MPRKHALVLAVVGSWLLAGVAQAAPGPVCGTPAALRGELVLPAHTPMTAPGRTNDKGLLFAPLDGRLDTKNFTIQWQPDVGDTEMAGVAGEALEASWQALIVERGWVQPVSADAYLLPVFIDASIVATGLTAEYPVDDYPEGVPIIYLHPDSAANPQFFRALAGHELHHAIQYRMRGVYSAQDGESWYWEASAEWASELAQPELDAYAWSAPYYSLAPGLRFDSVEQSHQYGMFLLNAYLEEHVTGAGGMRAVWERSEDRADATWDTLLEESTGLSVDALWGGFVAAMAGEDLREASIYEPVVSETLVDGVQGRIALLGADYFRVPSAGTIVLVTPDPEERAIAVGAGGQGDVIEVVSGEVVGVLGLSDGGADYELGFTRAERPVDDDDSGAGCTCGGSSSRSFAILGLLLPSGLLRRRR